jgi:hypothetical protein
MCSHTSAVPKLLKYPQNFKAGWTAAEVRAAMNKLKKWLCPDNHGRMGHSLASLLCWIADERAFGSVVRPPRAAIETAITKRRPRQISVNATSVLTQARITDAPMSRQLANPIDISHLVRQAVLDRSAFPFSARSQHAPRLELS